MNLYESFLHSKLNPKSRLMTQEEGEKVLPFSSIEPLGTVVRFYFRKNSAILFKKDEEPPTLKILPPHDT